ncbi:MAG: ComEA family DNA-binding protein [Lachnospiraceae bacterium]|uniref:ComEA family DNA-binding protein n=1 Tax=Candidatus Weimeria bifida TaxID=2599074 RepID=A0A6N7IZD8_9FIRM|nr:ComEA family DNA-binding protein [Candidatus Weimeria bifida]RRF97039.1 MAG: ComEA family DNA-binding protein [Lachnospiraceae bacterium]
MKRIFFLLVLVMSLILGGCADSSYLEKNGTASGSDQKSESKSKGGETALKSVSKSENSSKIYVQIDGAVKKPGVYALPADSRVFVLIEKAGGLRKDAASSALNQAEKLTDGQKLTILTKSEYKKNQSGEGTAVNPGTASSGSAVSGSEGSSGLIDINRADKNTLTTISGIGPTRADAIIEYRTKNGPFKNTKDITNVSGIGDATFQKIKDKITV